MDYAERIQRNLSRNADVFRMSPASEGQRQVIVRGLQRFNILELLQTVFLFRRRYFVLRGDQDEWQR